MIQALHPSEESQIDEYNTCPVKECCLVASICTYPLQGKKVTSEHQKFGKGSLVWYDESENGRVIIICNGLAAISWYSQEGEERILRILGKGKTIGYATLFNLPNYPGVLRACTDLEICQYPKEDLEGLMGNNLEVTKYLIRCLNENYWDLEQQVRLLSTTSASERVKQALMFLAKQLSGDIKDVELPLTHNDLSALTGLNRVTVSRILKELEDSGEVKRGYGSLIVNFNPQAKKLVISHTNPVPVFNESRVL